MTRKIAFALTALALTLATGVTAALAGTTGASADPGVTERPRSCSAAPSPLSGARLGVRLGGARRGRVLQVRQRARAASTAARSTYKYLDDAYNPAQTVQVDAPARRAGQGLRDLQRARHRAEPRRSATT